MKNIQIGQKVWFKSRYSSINSGTVTEIGMENNIDYVRVKCDTGTMGAKITDCYESLEELKDANRRETEAKVSAYCSQIQSVEDLVKFMYEKPLNGDEYIDYEAKAAVEIRASELLGLDLTVAARFKAISDI